MHSQHLLGRTRPLFVMMAALAFAGADCDGGPGDGGDAGPGEEEDCIVGDPEGEAELALVVRTVEGEAVDLVDGDEVPLILPPQGGKVTLIGVRAKNVTCRALLNAGLADSPCGGGIIGRDGRPVEFDSTARDDGFFYPRAADTLQNYANIPVCPTFASSRDGDGQPYVLELRITEERRKGEDAARTHVLSATVTPVCAEEDILEDCLCECDADFILEVDRTEQCPTINDNDTAPGTCPTDEAE